MKKNHGLLNVASILFLFILFLAVDINVFVADSKLTVEIN